MQTALHIAIAATGHCGEITSAFINIASCGNPNGDTRHLEATVVQPVQHRSVAEDTIAHTVSTTTVDLDRIPSCNVADCHSGGMSPAVLPSWKAIARSRATRMAIGGCVARKSAMRPDFALTLRPSGSAMQRCATPDYMRGVGAPACSILSRAEAEEPADEPRHERHQLHVKPKRGVTPWRHPPRIMRLDPSVNPDEQPCAWPSRPATR